MSKGNKLILTQICKNEEHVIGRMLTSIKGIIDIICMVDTGSTDGTIEYIKKWGVENNIETYVFERPFDNFENSRNYSIEMSKKITSEKNDGYKYYGIWLDCDEEIVVSDNFDKNKMDKDLYMITTHIGSMEYTRNEVWNIDKDFEFYGPVHEYLRPITKNITSGLLDGLSVNVKMDGASWKEGSVAQKYKKHADIFEEYLMKDRDPRWIFYTAQSWHDSASTKSKSDNDERLRRSLNYYRERVSNNDGYPEERYYSQLRIGMIRSMLEDSWSEVQSELLKAYSIDPARGESIKVIIEHYQQMGEWNLSNLFSEMAYNNFHNKSPYPKRVLFIDSDFYKWRALELHMNSLLYIKNIPGAKKLAKELIDILNSNIDSFKDVDKNRISNNTSRILSLN